MSKNKGNKAPTTKPIPFDRGTKIPPQKSVPPMPKVNPPKPDK